MQKVKFLIPQNLDNGERNGVHLGYQRYAVGDVVELSDTSVARWLKRGAVELVVDEVKAVPAAKPAPAPEVKAAPATKLPAAADATASDASADAAATSAPLPPFGAPAKK